MLPGGVSGYSEGVCARVVMELSEVVRCPTSLSVRNFGTGFLQVRMATAAQVAAFKDLDAAGAITDADGTECSLQSRACLRALLWLWRWRLTCGCGL